MARHKILVAGYGLPAEFGIHVLLGLGMLPDEIAVLTYRPDARNSGLVSICELRGIPVSFASSKSQEALDFVSGFGPDIILSLHYRDRIPLHLLNLAPLGGANIHPSLLPKYRGAASGSWALINGDQVTGFTFHRLEEDFDTGNILIQKELEIRPDDTAFSLFFRQIVEAVPFIGQVVEMLLNQEPGIPQPETGGSYFGRDLPFGGKIDPSWDDARVDRFIRAMYFPPFKPAIFECGGTTHQVATLEEYKKIKNG